LTGDIPKELGLMRELTFLDLEANLLTGPIPTSFGNLSELYYLGLIKYQLSGPVPATLGYIPSLDVLGVSSNNLEGNLEFLSSLSNCRELQALDIYNNSFSGGIPVHVYKIILVWSRLKQVNWWGSIIIVQL
ncbi:hypothetical protein BAE44_0024332, partial [Dichanthelium oligosanthes]